MIMHHKFFKFGALIALVGSLAWSAGAASTSSFSAGGKSSASATVTESGELNAGSITESISQTIVLTPAEEAQFNANTTVSTSELLDAYQFSFSEDPKYVPGAKSVKIKKTLQSNGIISNISISAKWGNGLMTISIKSKTTGPISPKKPMKSKTTRDYAELEYKTIFKQGLSTILEAPVQVRYSYSERETHGVSYDGSQSYGNYVSYKSGPFNN